MLVVILHFFYCFPLRVQFLGLIDPFIEKEVLSLADLKDFCAQKKPAQAIEALGTDPDTASRLVEVCPPPLNILSSSLALTFLYLSLHRCHVFRSFVFQNDM